MNTKYTKGSYYLILFNIDVSLFYCISNLGTIKYSKVKLKA